MLTWKLCKENSDIRERINKKLLTKEKKQLLDSIQGTGFKARLSKFKAEEFQRKPEPGKDFDLSYSHEKKFNVSDGHVSFVKKRDLELYDLQLREVKKPTWKPNCNKNFLE